MLGRSIMAKRAIFQTVRMYATKTDKMEHMDDIFKQMNQKIQDTQPVKQSSIPIKQEEPEEELLQPRVGAVKEDVVFLNNPNPMWKFNKVLRMTKDDQSVVHALTLSLKEEQTIGLMLEKSSLEMES